MKRFLWSSLIVAVAILVNSRAQAQTPPALGYAPPTGGAVHPMYSPASTGIPVGAAPTGPITFPQGPQGAPLSAGPTYTHPHGRNVPGNGCLVPPCDGQPALFASDRAFPEFVGPISNPVLAKDPRSLTEVRFLFLNQKIDAAHPFGGGDFQVVGAQIRVALTERLSFIADKDGYIWLNPGNLPSTDGWANIAAGLKYLLVRDVENQFLLSVGFQYELPSGTRRVFQGHGDGTISLFMTAGKECNLMHFLSTFAAQVPLDDDQNSTFLAWSVHADVQIFERFYPLVELNWFHYLDGGNRGLPAAIGEGAGLLNLGTSGIAGNELITLALGLKTIVCPNLDVGFAYELPISGRRDLLNNRILVELIARY